MTRIDEMTRNDDIRNILKGYTNSDTLINQVVTYTNMCLPQDVQIKTITTYSVTLTRKRESIVIILELSDANDTKIFGRNEISNDLLKFAK